MKQKLLLLLMLLAMCPVLRAQTEEFDRWFAGGTLRLDCLRGGALD